MYILILLRGIGEYDVYQWCSRSGKIVLLRNSKIRTKHRDIVSQYAHFKKEEQAFFCRQANV